MYRWEKVGKKLIDRSRQERQVVLDSLFPAATPMYRKHITCIYRARITDMGHTRQFRAFLLRFLPHYKELKRNMKCLETAVISQEEIKGTANLLLGCPIKIIKERKKEVIQSRILVQK